MTDAPCPQCGAPGGARDCRERFEQLLALDHSRRAPWGPRHALAVAVYTLQHPEGSTADALERCWLIAYRCGVLRDDPWQLSRGLVRARLGRVADQGVPSLPTPPAAGEYAVTISDLALLDADAYPQALFSWAQATVDHWRRG